MACPTFPGPIQAATGHEDKQALDRMLELDAKAKELKSRNLDRYMHQLQYAKRECERQLVQLGGRDYRADITSSPASAASRSPQQGRKVRPPFLPISDRGGGGLLRPMTPRAISTAGHPW